MKRVLLVEPNYKNKYPPIGLMKLSTYFKSMGCYVQFHKGLLCQNEAKTFDVIFVTSLFTFDLEMCLDTIRYYAAIIGAERIFVGGIAASIMPDRFRDALPGVQVIEGQLTSSKALGFSDNTNIDALELDYDILWDVPYKYPAENSYFLYTSRGCPRKCSFCAVKTLEPVFMECPNIREQIVRVDEKFGTKKHLLIMDNNILVSTRLKETVEALETLGFGKSNNVIQSSSSMPGYLRGLWERIRIGKPYVHLLDRIKSELMDLCLQRINHVDCNELESLLLSVKENNDDVLLKLLKDKQKFLLDFFSRYCYHRSKRYVDFNQGLDARLFSSEKIQLLSRLAVKPCRIAFDSMKTRDDYLHAMDLAVENGITYFSNYMLYNYTDRPEELWSRLSLNISYCKEHKGRISLFSFPMKYAAIDRIDRNYVGEHWNNKYLKSMNVILNVTSGVVAKEEDFFIRAFGQTEAEFLEILSMPYDFIRYRNYFDECQLIPKWREQYHNLTQAQKDELLAILSTVSCETDAPIAPHTEGLAAILPFYMVKKGTFEKNRMFFLRQFAVLEER